MPVETRTCNGRHYARPVVQNHQRLPLIRFESPHERRRRNARATVQTIIIFALGAAMFVASGLFWREFLTW